MDKFSELIAQGVANFEYKPITQSTPSNPLEDPDYEMIRMYNNLYSIATNTHMSRTEEGDIVVTGTLVKDKKYFDRCFCRFFKVSGGISRIVQRYVKKKI